MGGSKAFPWWGVDAQGSPLTLWGAGMKSKGGFHTRSVSGERLKNLPTGESIYYDLRGARKREVQETPRESSFRKVNNDGMGCTRQPPCGGRRNTGASGRQASLVQKASGIKNNGKWGPANND